MAKAKQKEEAPMVDESIMVEDALTTNEGAIEAEQDSPVESISVPELTKFEKQLGVTTESFTGEYSPSVDLKLKFASIMELMHNYHMSCESKNDARYKDIMNHILTSCELASTFVR